MCGKTKSKFKTGDRVILSGESDGSWYQDKAKEQGLVGRITGTGFVSGMYTVDFGDGAEGAVAEERLSLSDLSHAPWATPVPAPVYYPREFKPLLDAAIAVASAKRQAAATRKAYQEADQAQRDAYKRKSEADTALRAALEEASRL